MVDVFAEQTCFIGKLATKVSHADDGGVAHRLEQDAHNVLVAGSIPATPTNMTMIVM